MYYRRKILLALLQVLGGEADKQKFQKLLFLFTRKQPQPAYEFVPYMYGCFSFQANADMSALQKHGLLKEQGNIFCLKDAQNWAHQLKSEDRAWLNWLISNCGKLTQSEIVEYTYRQYPWFAINSRIKGEVLDATGLKAVEASRPQDQTPKLFTIGYEGLSIDAYLSNLLKNNVRLLCDVRRNSLSMKYGFSKSQLQKSCPSVGIEYVHLPELGIASELRQNLDEAGARERLFEDYAHKLERQGDALQLLCALLERHKRMALTCFEHRVCDCHRGVIAASLQALPGWNHSVQHL